MNPSSTQFKNAENFTAAFSAFKSRYEEAREAAEITSGELAPGFNIFKLLEKERIEKVHSDFIAYLLNPYEHYRYHSQGHLFLQTFFQMLQDKYPDLPLPEVPLDHGSWLLERDTGTTENRPDIILRNPSLKALYLIENKVDAREQPRQIARYADYLARQAKVYPNQGLFFLTPNGRPATTDEGRPYYRISYHDDIRSWLKRALPEVKAPTVCETVQQYLNLIQDL